MSNESQTDFELLYKEEWAEMSGFRSGEEVGTCPKSFTALIAAK